MSKGSKQYANKVKEDFDRGYRDAKHAMKMGFIDEEPPEGSSAYQEGWMDAVAEGQVWGIQNPKPQEIWPTYIYGQHGPDAEATVDAAVKASRDSGEEVTLKFPSNASIGNLLYKIESRKFTADRIRQGWWRVTDPKDPSWSFLIHYSSDYPLHRGTLIGAPADYEGWFPVDHPKWFDKNPKDPTNTNENPKRKGRSSIRYERHVPGLGDTRMGSHGVVYGPGGVKLGFYQDGKFIFPDGPYSGPQSLGLSDVVADELERVWTDNPKPKLPKPGKHKMTRKKSSTSLKNKLLR